MLQRGDAIERGLAVMAAAGQPYTPLPLLRPAPSPHAGYELSKRLVDIVAATFLLAITLPLVLLACLIIIFSTGDSPLLRQRRVGWLGREFSMLKLRTMRSTGVEAGTAPSSILPKDPHNERITFVGRFLRRTSIDELPQLLNVLAGQMSLVGPRPGLPEEVAQYRPSWRRRLTVKPGLSGLWQVSGRSAVPAERWMAMDRYYVTHRSVGFDLWVMMRTIAAVLSMRGAW